MTADTATSVDQRFTAEPPSVRVARQVLARWLDGPGGVVGDQADDLSLVLSELAGNAVRAGATWFRVKASRDGAQVVLEVADDGHGFDAVIPGADDVPDRDAEDGRGLYLVRTLVDRCTIFTNNGGTIVRCRTEIRLRSLLPTVTGSLP